MFVDQVAIAVTAGKGGDGAVSFRREKYIPRGGPDGGDGGNGGDVIILAEAGVDTLSALSHQKHWKAVGGQPGGPDKCHGRNAPDLVIKVPPGTLVRDGRQGHILKDLTHSGDQIVAAHGGRGGKGNTRFKSATDRAPRTFTPGSEGESRELILELKVIADVGLCGKPNAGKSTLLSRLSHARPAIADYPFTTKTPQLGIVQIDLDHSFVMADVPGLIEGASEGAGLGHEFLRHLERTRVLVHLVEPQPMDGTDPIENYRTIRSELEHYGVNLTDRPEIVVVSKADLPVAAEVQQRLSTELGRPVMTISAVTGQGLNDLRRQISAALAAVQP